MSSFRILNQAPTYLLADGSVNAGGKLYFYENDLTTPKNTWSDEAMTVLNPNPVIMDASGRTLTDVWGLGEYGVKMTNSADVVQWTRNQVQQSGDAGATIPALQNGEFLTNDGTNLLWDPIRQVPDPTGHSGQVLFNDGSLAFWQALPVTPDPPDPDIVVTSSSFQAGVSSSTTKYFTQFGSDSAAASGAVTATDSVTFTTPFISAPKIFVIVTTFPVNAAQVQPTVTITSKSSVGFTVMFNTETDGNPSKNITTAVGYDWFAVGTRIV